MFRSIPKYQGQDNESHDYPVIAENLFMPGKARVKPLMASISHHKGNRISEDGSPGSLTPMVLLTEHLYTEAAAWWAPGRREFGSIFPGKLLVRLPMMAAARKRRVSWNHLKKSNLQGWISHF
jgi:hypothetical protein